MEEYDLIIIGAGCSGITSAIYAGRQKLKLLLLESGAVGGQLLLANVIENYPGFPKVSGMELAKNLEKQLDKLGIKAKQEEVVDLRINEFKEVECASGKTYKAKAVILATGATHKKLGISGEAEFAGKGVSYCATCDGAFFKDKVVAVIGGGNTAVDSALYLNEIAKKVYLIHRRQGFRAEEVLMDELNKSKIEQMLDTVCEEITGDKFVNSLKIKNVKTNETKNLKLSGVFVNVGEVPVTALAKKIGVELDENSYVKVNKEQETSKNGIFAAGDITGGLKQIVTAEGEGAVAAISAYKYIRRG